MSELERRIETATAVLLQEGQEAQREALPTRSPSHGEGECAS